VVGDNEASEGRVAVRKHREGDLGASSVEDFAASLSAAILARE
jgi:threonyl-tRNA synthetase